MQRSRSSAIREKKVPAFFEEDTSKFVAPHKWQIQLWAKCARRLLRHHAYTQWSNEAFSSVSVHGAHHFDSLTAPAIIIANHQSHLDPFLVHRVLPDRIKWKLFYAVAQDRWFVKDRKKLVLHPWYQSLAMGTFPVLRGGGREALSHARWLLEKGQNVFLFPEGTRATRDQLGEFKHGAAILAIESGAAVLPIYLAGLKALRPKGQLEVSPGPVEAHVLPPMKFAPDADVAEATAQLRNALGRLHQVNA